MQTDKGKLSRLLLAQKPRQLAFAADRERWAAHPGGSAIVCVWYRNLRGMTRAEQDARRDSVPDL
jgi:hypothetical protein